MKTLFKASIFLGMSITLVACGQSIAPTASPDPSSTATGTASATPLPSVTPSPTITLTDWPQYVPPTLIPTIDPTLVPGLLSKAFSVQTMEGPNAHKMQQISGWEHGFGTIVAPYYYCPSYVWLDTNHILLNPITGQSDNFIDGAPRFVDIVLQPMVTNLDTGASWLPPVNISSSDICNRVYWSSTLGVLISSQFKNNVSTITTYTYDGSKLASYPGSIIDISPSGTKILIAQDTLLDLRTNRRIKLNWSLEDYNQFDLTRLFWTSDEKRVYRCCYFYADLTTGISHRFERSDFHFTDGTHLNPNGLWFYRGGWIRNDTYFLAEWSWIDDGDIRYLPLFDPATKIFYDVREMTGISEEWHCQQTMVSPDGSYVWMTGWGGKEEGSYLVNLTTFESHYFPGKAYLHIKWSPSSKFAWLYYPNPVDDTEQYSIFSVSEKEIRPLPIAPLPDSDYWWHPSDDIVAYPAAKKDVLIFLNMSTMSYQELPFNLQTTPYTYGHAIWSPGGEKLAMVAEDGSVWQVDYLDLAQLEQLTPPLPNVHSLEWSPDGDYISFVSDSDIYIVETAK